MTQEEIIKKAFEAYPTNNKMCTIEGKYTKIDTNKNRREGYIKALTDLNLDAIRGEAMHEIADRYEALPKIKGWVARDDNEDNTLRFFVQKPFRRKGFRDWFMSDARCIETEIPNNLFPEITWESEPVEVELIIRKV